jgi:hypothetical protein
VTADVDHAHLEAAAAPAPKVNGFDLFIASLPFLFLPYDSLTYLLGFDLASTAQTLPLTSLFSLPYLVLCVLRLRLTPTAGKIAARLFICLLWMLTLWALGFILTDPRDGELMEDLRTIAGSRQALSFFLGLTSFLMFADALARGGQSHAMRMVLLGSIPNIIAILMQFFGGDFRVQGLSSEPSHLADYVVFAVIPALYVLYERRWYFLPWLGAGTMLIGLTFSTTGYLKLVGFLFAKYGGLKRIWRGVFVFALVAVGLATLYFLFPDNYISLTMRYMLYSYNATGELAGGSWVDRWNGFVGPVTHVITSMSSWLGYGFGADTIYFYKLFSPEVAREILALKGDIPSISSMHGKLLLYLGPIGYALYLSTWWKAYRSSPPGHIARALLPAVLLGSLFSLAPFHLPYVWFAMAMGATALPAPVLGSGVGR